MKTNIRRTKKKSIRSNTKEDWTRGIRATVLARKYECSPDYVSKILRGYKESDSILAKKIQKDVSDIVEILERKTMIQV